jgi:ABC-type Fe3+ transport system permease subunit
MNRFLDKTRHYLWIAVEISFLIVVLSVLLHIALGQSSGGFVKDVYDNLVAFGNAVPGATLLGVGALMLLVWYIQQRMKEEKEEK